MAYYSRDNVQAYNDEYSIEQIIEIYENYSRLTDAQLLDLIHSELNKILFPQFIVNAACASDTVSSFKDQILNKIDILKVFVRGLKTDGKNETISRYCDNIRRLCTEIIDTNDELQRILNSEKNFEIKRNRLCFLLEHSSSVEEFQQTCFSLFKELPQKISYCTNKYRNSSNTLLDCIIYLAPFFAENYLYSYQYLTLAVGILLIILKNHVFFSQNKNKNKKKNPRYLSRPRFDFYEMGLKTGDILNWKYDTSIFVRVRSNRTISFNGDELSLTKVTRDLKQANVRNPCRYWIYNKKLLSEIYDETYPPIF